MIIQLWNVNELRKTLRCVSFQINRQDSGSKPVYDHEHVNDIRSPQSSEKKIISSENKYRGEDQLIQ